MGTRDREGEAPAEPHGARTSGVMARQEARLPNSFTPSLPWRGIIFIAGGDPKIMRSSCENPLSGGERRLQPSGVDPARLEQPTPTPLPRRGIKFIPRGAHFHALGRPHGWLF
ncbi:MAG: hypothetical protein DMG05_24470 [Acidobacteria bacterium]|nr:MAG: hypothetical protein DMG05_24470 [Acidobacteriota bacterium]